MTNLEGKVALITGFARGIGKAIAERLARLGASMIVNYSASEQPAEETVSTIERLGGAALRSRSKLMSRRWLTSIVSLRRR